MARATKKTLDVIAKFLSCPLCFTILGRALTKKLMGRHSVRGKCREWYLEDDVHLNKAGYDKLSESLYCILYIDTQPFWHF